MQCQDCEYSLGVCCGDREEFVGDDGEQCCRYHSGATRVKDISKIKDLLARSLNELRLSGWPCDELKNEIENIL